MTEYVKIEIFAPAESVVLLREALHAVGAGHVGNYDHCMSVSQVTGYWLPLSGARPYDGTIGELSEGSECKIELRCPRSLAADAVRAIRAAHPYEEPVINVLALLPFA
jgi:hypothetical protein